LAAVYDSDKPKPNWNRKDAKGAKVYENFFLGVLGAFAVENLCFLWRL
jgi:hypothetical protein